MKKLQSVLSLIFAVSVLSLTAQCCTNTSTKTSAGTAVLNETIESNDVQVYYFHATRRCATCEAVESVTASALKEYYGDKISFTSINRDEEKMDPMLVKYKVSGQTLLIVKGDEMVNLTPDAFMNARSNPDKLKAKIKSTVDSML